MKDKSFIHDAMDDAGKENILNQVYRIYDDFTNGLEVMCRKTCATCCTCNVTLTTLEGMNIYRYLQTKDGMDLMARIETALSAKRFQPEMTINHLAERCRQGDDIAEAHIDHTWGSCPLLMEDVCAIYPVRPLGCRCLLSTVECRHNGFAQIDDFVVSVSQVFLQVIEHIDANGFSGNLIDMLAWIDADDDGLEDGTEAIRMKKHGLIPNRAMTVLMIPPEHRASMAPLLRALNEIKYETA